MRGRLGLNPPRLTKNSLRFEQIPEYPYEGYGHDHDYGYSYGYDRIMSNPRDVTIDIPLTDTPSRGQNGTSRWGSGSNTVINSADAEKSAIAGHGHQHHHRHGRRRRRQDTDINDGTGKPSESSDDGSVNLLGRIYQAIYNFSIITRYMIYVIPIGALIAIPIIIGATAAQDAYIGGVHIYWFFTWIEVVWVSLWVCKLFSKFIPFGFQALCGIVSSGTRKYALILRALEVQITLVLWVVVSLVTFLPIMRYGVNDTTAVVGWETTIKNILFALLICTLIYLAEKLIVQLISISYHRKQFDAKIKESKHNTYLVGLLFEASRNMFPIWCQEFADEDALIFDSLLAEENQGANKRNSLMPMRLMKTVGRQVGQNVGRIGDKVTTAFGSVASELTGKQVFNPTATHSIVVQALDRKRCAAALARRIWMSFVVEGREALYMEDIVEVLGPEHEAEAEECFNALDKDGNGDISLDEMILTITEFGRLRKSLNNSMHDVDQAIHVLDNLLLTVASIVGVLVFISFVTAGFGTVIAAGATTLISLSFIFSVTAQEVLGSCIFLFVKHPFDIGDRVEVMDKSYIVERISLLFSVFRNIQDHRITQVPNNILNSLWIDNFTRANAMHERLVVPVSFDTSFAEIQALREEMEAFVRDKDNSRDFQPDIDIEVIGVGDMDRLQIQVDIRHKSNWSNEIVRGTRRSKFMCALVLAMRKVKIRAPGVAAPEEDAKSDAGSDDGKDDDADKSAQSSAETGAAAAAAAINTETLAPNTAQTTGYETDRPSGTLSQRGSTASREAAIAGQLNSRPPVSDIHDAQGEALQRTTTGSSSNQRQLSVNNGANDTASGVSRGLSTGHRKAGTHVSYHEDAPPVPQAPLSPVQAGMTPSSSAVPILGNPPQPGSRGSMRYEPPSQTSTQNQPQPQRLPIIGSPESDTYHPYYNQDNSYDPAPVAGGYNNQSTGPAVVSGHRRSGSGQPVSGVTASSQYEQSERFDPISPPSVYSPQAQSSAAALTQPQESRRSSFLSRTLKRGKDSKTSDSYGDEA